jgi:hypothetical protein
MSPAVRLLPVVLLSWVASAFAEEDLAGLRERLEAAERTAAWVPALLILVAALVAIMVVMAWRMRRPPSERQSTSPGPFAPAKEADTVRIPPPVPAPAPDEPLPPTMAYGTASAMPHGLSIEEHIDIDQQAEFLVVLGQDEAAIDLLLEHLRGTGGTSPLPYLRLMQIYRRRGDQAAYERTRERFNQRFNALAPQWQADPGVERSLEHYPEAMTAIAQAWATPLDAMAVIESLLFRRGTEDERFDLPAYEELLFLYWLTRELQQRADAPPSQVDVLLPIDEGQAEVSVIQRAEAPRRSAAAYDTTAVITQVEVDAGKAQAQAKVDLDLSTVPADPDDV